MSLTWRTISYGICSSLRLLLASPVLKEIGIAALALVTSIVLVCTDARVVISVAFLRKGRKGRDTCYRYENSRQQNAVFPIHCFLHVADITSHSPVQTRPRSGGAVWNLTSRLMSPVYRRVAASRWRAHKPLYTASINGQFRDAHWIVLSKNLIVADWPAWGANKPRSYLLDETVPSLPGTAIPINPRQPFHQIADNLG